MGTLNSFSKFLNGGFSACILFGSVLISPVYGFDLGDHSRFTKQAILEFNECMGRILISADQARIIDESNLDQDLDLVRKWAKYSHYYHPFKNLDMRREDAMVSVDEYQRELLNHPDRPFAAIGGAIHFLQDVAAPPHVTPVTHNFLDGFESLDLPESWLAWNVLGEEKCAFIDRAKQEGAGLTLKKILRDTAIDTLAVTQRTIEIRVDGAMASTTWREAFWKPSPPNDDSFGSYGFFGNSFGESEVVRGGVLYEIPGGEYFSLKLRQARQAIESTKLALYYLISVRSGTIGGFDRLQ